MQDIEAPDSDQALIQRTAAGDRDAFATLYRRHQGSVYRFARLMTGSAPAAEDVVQEVFLALMKDAARYDAGRAALTTYLFGIARRITRRRLLRERRFIEIDAVEIDVGNSAKDVATERQRGTRAQGRAPTAARRHSVAAVTVSGGCDPVRPRGRHV
jgi:RNA polymerase sigma-70 factor (ECF subfamily)